MRKERKTVILNVDDVDTVRYGTTRVLKKAGFKVWEVGGRLRSGSLKQGAGHARSGDPQCEPAGYKRI